MFKKNKCNKCGKKTKSNHDFCPYCGNLLNENHKKDWGILGRNDKINEEQKISEPIFGGDMFSKMLGSAMKMLQKEMQKQGKGSFIPGTNFRMMVNGKEINFNGPKKVAKKPVKEVTVPSSFSSESLKKFTELPREEPLTNVRRIGDRIIYEIEIKGIQSIKDIAIIKLEKSIEIKAVSKDKSYFKLIPLNLPIVNFEISNENVILEFSAK